MSYTDQDFERPTLTALEAELLAELKRTANYARAMERSLGIEEPRNVTLQSARAAIAKAEGR